MHFPVPGLNDPVELFGYYMESLDICRSDLISSLNNKERVSEVLNRKQGLSLEIVRRLNVGLGLVADLLIGKKAQKTTRKSKAWTVSDIGV